MAQSRYLRILVFVVISQPACLCHGQKLDGLVVDRGGYVVNEVENSCEEYYVQIVTGVRCPGKMRAFACGK